MTTQIVQSGWPCYEKLKSRRALLRLARTVLNKPTGENEGEKNGKEKQKKGKRQKSPRAEKSRQQSW